MHDIDRTCYPTCPLGYYGLVTTKICVDTCPSGRFANTITSSCDFCNFNCLTCDKSSTNCLSCRYSWLSGLPTCSEPACNLLYYHNSLKFVFLHR